jgi:N-formylglutamate amidohydrolase
MDQQTPTAWHLLHTPDMGLEIVRPQGEATNLVYSLPHSGRYYPDSFVAEARLSGTTLRLSEDAWVDDMVGLTPELGVYGLIGRYARAFCDVNRNPLELDARLIRGELPKAALSLSARVKAGFGVVARRLSADLDIYRQPLDMAEVSRRIDLIHRPYHMALQALLREAGRGGRVRLIDWHSMPSSALLHPSVNGMRPDIVLGTLHGESSAEGAAGPAAAGKGRLARRPEPPVRGGIYRRKIWPPDRWRRCFADRDQPRHIYERGHLGSA